jgi:transcription antitermination factor NusG
MIPLDRDTYAPSWAGVLKLPWYGIRTKSNHERVAAVVLQNKGYEQYLPVYRRWRRWSDRVVETDRPLFPGYVFCRFDARKRLPIVSTPGVVSVVGFGNEPAPISDSEIETVRAVLRSGLAAEPCPFLRDGQRIRVRRGSLEGLEGILLKKKSDWRIVVSVAMLQRSVAVEIDREWIAIT